MMIMKKISIIILSIVLLASLLAFTSPILAENSQCTSIVAGKDATMDGSVMVTTSLDGGRNSWMLIQSGKKYEAGTIMDRLGNYPSPKTYEHYLEQVKEGYTVFGDMPQAEETYRFLYTGSYQGEGCGGINEHGVTMGINAQGMKPELINQLGTVSPNMNHPSSSLIGTGLARGKTAREAIQIMGAMAEKYGFNYRYSPKNGVNIPVADKNEVWLFEVMGPGPLWKPGSDRLGAVWCAQRIPDDEVGANANRSRIGEIDLNNPDYFMASSNIYSLAFEMGWWKEGEPFVFYEAYAPPGREGSRVREWGIYNLLAPSLNLDPHADQYPFSVKPDKLISVGDLMTIHRDYYKGSEFDITEDPAFFVDGEKSPLARPWGPKDLHNLLGIKQVRNVGTPASGYVFVAQLRNWLPDPIAGCMWFAYGPAYTSCLAPIYSGITRLPESWSCGVDPDYPPSWLVEANEEIFSGQINRNRTVWNFLLVHDLSMVKYQEAIKDVEAVFEPAEANFFAMQPDFESAAVEIFNNYGQTRAEEFVTAYTNSCLNSVSNAYYDLVDYLLFKYIFRYSNYAPSPKLPTIALPLIPE